MVTQPPDNQQAPGAPASWEIEQLLVALERIPRSELPDGPDRDALAQLIRLGEVDNLYSPLGADYHNIAWATDNLQADPRERVTAWLELRRSAEGGDA